MRRCSRGLGSRRGEGLRDSRPRSEGLSTLHCAGRCAWEHGWHHPRRKRLWRPRCERLSTSHGIGWCAWHRAGHPRRERLSTSKHPRHPRRKGCSARCTSCESMSALHCTERCGGCPHEPLRYERLSALHGAGWRHGHTHKAADLGSTRYLHAGHIGRSRYRHIGCSGYPVDIRCAGHAHRRQPRCCWDSIAPWTHRCLRYCR